MFDCISDTIVQCIILVLRQLCVGPAPGGWVSSASCLWGVNVEMGIICFLFMRGECGNGYHLLLVYEGWMWKWVSSPSCLWGMNVEMGFFCFLFMRDECRNGFLLLLVYEGWMWKWVSSASCLWNVNEKNAWTIEMHQRYIATRKRCHYLSYRTTWITLSEKSSLSWIRKRNPPI